MHPIALLLPLLAPVPDDFDGLRAAVVGLGDTDGDGVPDLALAHRPRPFSMSGAPDAAWPAVPHEPVVWVLSGKDGAVRHALGGPGGLGTELAVVGDLDGDGAAELAIGAGRRKGGGDEVLLLSTGPGTVLARLAAPEGLADFGRALAGGRQLTGDATPDLVIGARGGALVVDGATRQAAWWLEPRRGCGLRRSALGDAAPTLLPPDERPVWPEVRSTGWGSGSYPGMNVAAVCDLDGDGAGEVALSTPREPACEEASGADSQAEQRDARTRIVFSGGERAPLVLDTAGWCLVSGEDLDGDGVADLVTTTVNEHTRAWSGADGALLWEVSYLGGYLHAEGASLALTSDHDDDGVRDLAVGSNETFLDADAGGVTILSGRSGEVLKRHRVVIDSEPGPPGGGVGGADVAGLGDLDGDGLEELAVWEPVPQRLSVLSGADLSVRWRIDAASLPRPE
jgi:hypothetical protein